MSLKDRMIARIARMGPMTLADYMAECLHDPQYGYYATRDPLGRRGDFITAPEISQMFGELVGLWLAQVWMDQGGGTVRLVELGPGRGTLMADVLRATRAVPGFHDAVELHLVEASPTLRAVQSEALASYDPQFHDSLGDVPEGPMLLIANEFFDALPIRQFQMNDAGDWQERQVGASDGALIWGLAPPAPLEVREGFKPGMIVETCAPAEAIAEEIGRRVAQGGAALIVDYGDWQSRGDTFQALENHAFADPLTHPGNADLTAHVAFEPIARAAQVQASALTPQGVFLERLGITARAQALAARLEGSALEAHVAAHRRLTHPDEMGTLFKVLALTPKGAPPPPALDPSDPPEPR
ncbi:class I SAM-dependent methyltransferase [Gymnodinialimonas ceratoperidinii]|uniref:SAM-dependent methyltransferase n=1 Tax=Gymnodinialimonas ceratoperidinii TaxID=2856823 RepID=A0A8F6TYH4_9RHOB|nr:SAM-dependent methyltransferase [Gymnodinialimonas ceratoperidinii]QXT40783.1 SAM-dependent methyltransferase [Gymnodinialimonas ceratoperidinii]